MKNLNLDLIFAVKIVLIAMIVTGLALYVSFKREKL